MKKKTEEKYKAFCELGFSKQDDWMSQSIGFLNFLANKLIMKISRQPDIEFTREEADLSLDYDEFDEIKSRIPFSIGIEFINEEWISFTLEKNADIYRKEISGYKGTVKDFFMERNTNINSNGYLAEPELKKYRHAELLSEDI